VDFGVDNDCDGVAERGPTAIIVLADTSTEEQCGDILLDGGDSTDPDGNTPLSCSWELVSTPAGSTRTTDDIEGASAESATFEPDVAGDYTFSLVVRDSGDAASETETIVVNVDERGENTVPVAEAGDNQSAADTGKCTKPSGSSTYTCVPCGDHTFTLDGSASTDDDGDSLSYSWGILSGSAILSSTTAEKPVVTVSGPLPVVNETTNATVFIGLTVTDCMGESSTQDVLALVYACAGKP
jgi:hypothetical protein